MMIHPAFAHRPGAMVPLTVLGLVGLFGFVALAVDLGMLAVARNQAQNAADTAALAGSRQLNGDQSSNNNYSNAQTEAQNAATANSILGQAITTSQVTITIGSYTYDSAQNKFVINSNSKPNGENWSLVKAAVSTGDRNYFFAPVLGFNFFNTTATATAAHRPRDIVVVLDLSTSMRFDSLLGTPHNAPRTRSMNPDPDYPQFGHYYGNSSMLYYNGTPVIYASTGEIQGPCNLTVDTDDGPAIVKDFYQDTTAFGTSTSAFNNYPTTATPAPSSYATTPGGDNYLAPGYTRVAGPPFATNVYDLCPSANHGSPPAKNKDPKWESSGYPNFQGYTFGPSHWGKTFFIWPPDPHWDGNQHNCEDWRYRFFRDGLGNLFKPGSNDVNNTYFWDTNGNWLTPSALTYQIDYQEILYWLQNNGPNPFPPQLRSGGVLYYDHIPNPKDASFSTLNTRWWGSWPPADSNEYFWKAYIDYVLGLQQTGSLSWNQIVNQTGYGDDFAWGTVQVTVKPVVDGNRYMSYGDNPKRPLTHFWFGPMTFLDFTGNVNQGRYWWPGTVHEAPTWQLKASVQSALDDIRLNHPNDNIALVYFSVPKSSSRSYGFWNPTIVPLGHGTTQTTNMQNALWFSPLQIGPPKKEIRPADNNGADINTIPRANGGTDWGYALSLVFNQFSQNTNLKTYAGSPAYPGLNGGLGRKGAQKLVVFETDGVVNQRHAAALDSSGGAYNCFYNIRQDPSGANGNEYPTTTARDDTWVNAASDAQGIATQLCALDSASPPGYSTVRKPVLIHVIAFGSLFDPANTSNAGTTALTNLEQLQYTGGKAGGDQPTPTTALNPSKRIYGTYTQRITNMKNAFYLIMDDGVQVTLLQ